MSSASDSLPATPADPLRSSSTPAANPGAPLLHPHLDARAVLTLLLCCALWGLNQVAIKAVLPEVPSLVQFTLRSVLAFALVLGWMHWRGIRWRDHRHTLWPGLLAGLFFAIEFAMVFVGLQHTTAARSVVFINTSPFIVALVLAALLPAERLRPLQVSGLVLAFASIAWAFGDGLLRPGGERSWLGDLLVLGAALLWGLTTVTIRLSSLRSAPFELTLAYQLGMAALLAPLGAVLAGQTLPSSWSLLALGSLFYQAVIVTFASYLLWFWLLTRYPATKVQAFVFLSPLFGTLFAHGLLDEPLTTSLMGGLAGVALGLALLNRR
ncbi:MAG TPA: DMT family transporter [Burkholderiaceae bacterium]|nr:DMT family transporter [Burkholderiaceae bacterium]HNB43549.1 DMT family transporter [Burkholderiaceae bacterium]HNG78531.1 DMT family transporter [Burkholderiaceae bacterium]